MAPDDLGAQPRFWLMLRDAQDASERWDMCDPHDPFLHKEMIDSAEALVRHILQHGRLLLAAWDRDHAETVERESE